MAIRAFAPRMEGFRSGWGSRAGAGLDGTPVTSFLGDIEAGAFRGLASRFGDELPPSGRSGRDASRTGPTGRYPRIQSHRVDRVKGIVQRRHGGVVVNLLAVVDQHSPEHRLPVGGTARVRRCLAPLAASNSASTASPAAGNAGTDSTSSTVIVTTAFAVAPLLSHTRTRTSYLSARSGAVHTVSAPVVVLNSPVVVL